MKTGVWILVLFTTGCASHNPKSMTTAEALKDLDQRYSEKVGTANKTELVQEFGTADWCEPKAGGGESCRFYKPLGTVWTGDKENRSNYKAFDEVVADFDGTGTLREYKARSQR